MRRRNQTIDGLKSLLAVFFLFAGLVAQAQYSSGIEATVLDSSGAAIPGAQVTLTNQETHVSQSATANGQGLVHITHVPPGQYQISVSAAGFTTWEQKDVAIEGTDIRTIYPKLTPGATQSTVEVQANTSAVETTSGTVSRVLEQQTVQR